MARECAREQTANENKGGCAKNRNFREFRVTSGKL